MYTDTHAHLTSTTVLPHIEEMVERARRAGVDKIVNICTDEESLSRGLELAKKHPWIFNAAATTPHDVEKEGISFFPIVRAQAMGGELIAIGETGLDYYYEHSNRALQQEFLLRYFDLAQAAGLPLIFHCRDAFKDLFELADSHYKDAPAVLHCFTGSQEEARGVLARGWFVSVSGIATFKKAEGLREIIKYVPLNRLFIETDTPYLAPQSKRGAQNEPAFITETAALIATIKGVDVEEVGRATAENAATFFSFSKHLRRV